jgi:hypothetical protein
MAPRRRGTNLARVVWLSMAAVFAFTQLGFAQRGNRYFGAAFEPPVNNLKYDGQFTFARLKYTVGPGGYYYRNEPAWAHGYNTAEVNLDQILNNLTLVRPKLDGSNVFAVDDPELSKNPIAYMTEAGYWELGAEEATALGAYVKKGGFLIFDDFRAPPRGGGGWEQFAANMKRVLPDATIVPLTPADPIFHVFFDIQSFDVLPQAYDGGAPQIMGIYEDNDPKKRLMAIINFNTDVSQFWEFSATGLFAVSQSNEAYQLGVNYIVYGLTH